MSEKFEMFPRNQKGIVEVSQDWYDNHIKALASVTAERDRFALALKDIADQAKCPSYTECVMTAIDTLKGKADG